MKIQDYEKLEPATDEQVEIIKEKFLIGDWTVLNKIDTLKLIRRIEEEIQFVF